MIKENIIEYAKNILNIDAIGFCKPEIPTEDLTNYREYLAKKNYNDMLWLKTRQALREDPKSLMPSAKTAIVLGVNYNKSIKSEKDFQISEYADQQEDYHLWVYHKAKNLATYLKQIYGANSRYFVDSAPILEKVLAKQTSIGWQGKHTCIVSPKFGSWLFLAVVLTDIEISTDTPSKDYCGKCTKCLDACPTGALTPYKLDVKKCISYLTIEHKTAFPEDMISKLDNKVFGCDDCISACYFNKFSTPTKHHITQNNTNFPKDLISFLLLKEDDFKLVFKNTPLQRTGYTALLRNVLIALLNTSVNLEINKKAIYKLIALCSHNNLDIKKLALKNLNYFLSKNIL
jgi:epoxyqueuosine reductase